jgi:predicted enzyme related to lactoylglutathione lyase
MSVRWQCLCIDCADPEALATFWQQVLGWRITERYDDEVVVEPPADSPAKGAGPDLLFLKVPEAKSVKNRLHIDLRPDDRDAEVARIEALGATRVDIGQRGDETWVVLADPEGNEFCVLRTLGPQDAAYEGPTS